MYLGPRRLDRQAGLQVYPLSDKIKHSTIVIYDSSVVLTTNCQYYDSRVLIYNCRVVTDDATIYGAL